MKFFPIRLIGSSEFVRFHVTVVIGIAVGYTHFNFFFRVLRMNINLLFLFNERVAPNKVLLVLGKKLSHVGPVANRHRGPVTSNGE